MKKRTGITLLMAAIFFLTSCFVFGPVCRAQGENAQSATPGGDTVKVWFGANEQENAAMAQIAARFTSETGIDVEVISRRAIFDAPKDLVNYADLEGSPDIVYMQAPDIGGLVSSGYLEPIEITDDLKNRYADTAFKAFTLNGTCYGVGYNVSASGLIYNKKLISRDKLPGTWDEFFKLAENLTVKDASGEIVQRGTLLNARNMWFMYPIMKEYGGYYYGQYADGTYNAYDVGLDNASMLEYVGKIKELKSKGLVLESSIASESNIVSEFGAGRAAMILYGLWSADYFKKVGVNYGIAPLPRHGDGSSSQPLTTVEGFVINSHSDNVEHAKAFLDYILKDENQQILIEAGNGGDAKTGARNPANISVINSDYIQSDEILKSLSAIGEDCEPFPNIPEGTIWYNYTTTSLGAIFYGDSQGREVDARQELKELADAIRKDVALMNYKAERIDIEWWVYGLAALFIVVVIVLVILLKRYKNKRNPLYVKYEYKRKISLISWCLMLPLLILLALFYVYPIIHNVYLSLTDYSGINLSDYGIVGFSNYKDIFTAGVDGLLSMVAWTFIFAVCVVGLSFLLGTFVATILDRTNAKIAKFYRVIYILPWVIPTVITLLMWRGLLETDGGLINQILGLVGIPSVPWLSNPAWARLSTILVMVWFSFPYFMVISFGMLKSIPKDYYEAARIDGASNARIFRTITLPLIFKALVPTLIMSFIMQFNQFGVYLLTQGGPASDTLGAPGATDLLITYIFNTAFNTKRYAIAAAYSVILFIFIGIFAIVVMNRNKKRMEL